MAATPAPELVLDYIRALVWPALVVVLLIAFRGHLGALVDRVKKASGAGVSVEFSEKVDKLADAAGELQRGAAPERGLAAPDDPDLPAEPTAGFLLAYRDLEMAARKLGPALGMVSPLPVPVVKALVDNNTIAATAMPLAEELRAIRNEVAHGARQLDATDAAGLVSAIRSLAAVLRGVAAMNERPPPAKRSPRKG